ncbi:hypothetical protein FHL15_008552 [Xylaria flabelliformis]|uniref:DUF676 domain-containing protein n=1 Tax=Xylaria flabelliformis TaxID=2512241 RepID=A0A553HRK6_9PEZI|nr:hypothetical protein FHL15_008552 [Xylaria flabelliformis]
MARHKTDRDGGDRTEFFGSQVGGKSVINYSYTDLPWKLVAYDIKYFFTFAWALPWIIWPLRPCDGGDFDELSSTADNIWCISIHIVLFILQLMFLITLPIAFLLPVYLFIAALGVFFLINWLLCLCLNGKTITYESDPKYAPALLEHQHEQWIFLNGVAVGEAWLKSNINRLALTFKRPVLGIHNRTTGIIFDVLECLIQRNFGYATSDVRLAYKILKEKLYNPQYSKVVFILHSQGGIEGGLVLDWLLQELPQNLLAKLEVYTFGNAANHFNNPHRHVQSQEEEQKHPGTRTEAPEAMTGAPITHSPVETRASSLQRRLSNISKSSAKDMNHPQPLTVATNGTRMPPRRTFTVAANDRAIGHVEHYAHTTDFVALWGLLHFVTNERASPEMPRFIGRVFNRVSTRGGHQFCQHYLNGMFPLSRNEEGEFTGCADRNDFMDSVVEIAKEGTEKEDVREGFDNSWAMIELAGDPDSAIPSQVAVHGSFHGSLHGSLRGSIHSDDEELFDGTVRVKHLSRLWQYRNGRSPPDIPPGLVRGATF